MQLLTFKFAQEREPTPSGLVPAGASALTTIADAVLTEAEAEPAPVAEGSTAEGPDASEFDDPPA